MDTGFRDFVAATEKLAIVYSPTEIALSWVRDQPGVASAIVGARTGAQLRGALTVEEIEIPIQVK